MRCGRRPRAYRGSGQSTSAAGLGPRRSCHGRPRCPDRRRRRRWSAALRRAAHGAPRRRSLGRDGDPRLSRVSGSPPSRRAEARRHCDRRVGHPRYRARAARGHPDGRPGAPGLWAGYELRALGGRPRRHPRQLPRLDPRRSAALRPRLERDRRDLLDRERLRPARRPRRPLRRELRRRWRARPVPRRDVGAVQRRRPQGPMLYDPADAIPATANLLRQNGAPADYDRAIFAYNHAGWYVAEVLSRAARYRGAARDNPNATASFVTVADAAPTGACANAATGPADLTTAVRLTSPTAYRALPAWAMAGGRPAEPVDARIYDDVLWVLRRYVLRVSAARETGHHTHGDGTAVDLVPAVAATQADWDATAGRLATELGWVPSCGASGARPACPLKPAIQWVGYDGYPSHGSPRTCAGGCPAHIHVSWVSGCYGSSALVQPCQWVTAFPVPAGDASAGVA